MECSLKPVVGRIQKVFCDGVIAKFQWTLPTSLISWKGGCSSPIVKYFGITWRLEMYKFCDVPDLYLIRKPLTPGILGSARFTIGYRKPDGSEGDIARNGVFPQNVENLWWRHTAFLREKTSAVELLTITCTIWTNNLLYEEVVSRVTQREGASCTGGRIEEDPLKAGNTGAAVDYLSLSCPLQQRFSRRDLPRSPQVSDTPEISWSVSRAVQTEDASSTNSRSNEGRSKAVPRAKHRRGVKQRKGASCSGGRIDEHSLKGVSCATQTEDASCTPSRINEGHSKDVTRSTQTEDASCSNSRINEDSSKDISILLDHLQDLRISGDDHDFLMRVKDKEFRAHKCVLRARSPVFAAMFRSQMTESADDSVTIEDCVPDAFGQFLSYVYTGKVAISSASLALGLYYAGDKYDFPRLKEMSVDFLKNSLTAATISDVINMAVTHDEGELLQQALVYLATNLQEVMVTVEWQRFLITNPIRANEMCIKALQCVKRD